ncbi:unnamed protein product [Ostreobium quekettii]|uniref:F-box/LRR-repeat protein 15-like leucin rich repeat domain-containing protein n=1 Tax=Ostreobium quekettii TaxID=121088 RepID=A0A8S1IVF0_9CHLO|nr:unnamed protein product [Ostreobium quekettii]
MAEAVGESSSGGDGQVGAGDPDWGSLFHHVLDGVKAAMTEHEELVFLPCGRLVNRHWKQWATQATTHLELATRQHLCKERLECLVNVFTRLEHVTMMRAKDVNGSPLKHLPLLRHLWIPGGLSDVTHLGHFTALIDLDLAHLPLTYQDVKVVTVLTRLARLVVLFESGNGDEGVASLALLPALTDLKLTDAQLSDVGMRHLARLPVLVNCTLSMHATLSTVKAEILGTITDLVALDLSRCAVSANGDAAIHLQTLTNLTELHLPAGTPDAGLQALTCLTAISHIHISAECSNEGLRSLELFPSLSSLNMVVGQDVSNVGAQRIASLTGLVDLDLTVTNVRFTGDGVILLTALTALTALRLTAVREMTDRHVGHLGSLVALKTLHLTVCQGITSLGVGFISGLTRLTDLSLSHGAAITDAAVEKLANLRSLTELDLEGCSGITDAGMDGLTKLTALADLDLSTCHLITNAGVMKLAPLRFLRRLHLTNCYKVTMNIQEFLRKW